MASSRSVIIAGAGIGGLTAALALAQRGFPVAVFDQAQRLEEAGAGLQLSPNASRILIALGLGRRLQPHVVVPEELRVRDARTARVLARAPFGATAAERYDAPYWVIHRGDLQTVLLDAVREHPDIALALGTRVEDFAHDGKGVTITARAARPFEQRGLALIAADGLWSSLRERIGDRQPPRFARHTAWRALVPADALIAGSACAGNRSLAGQQCPPGPLSRAERHPHQYRRHHPRRLARARLERPRRARRHPRPISRGSVVTGGARRPGCAAALGQMGALRPRAARALGPGRGDIAGRRRPSDAALSRPGRRHGDRRCGGAGATAGGYAATIRPGAMRRYERQRQRRTARTQRAARRNGAIYHMGGPRPFCARSRWRPWADTRLLTSYDWLYGWKAA